MVTSQATKHKRSADLAQGKLARERNGCSNAERNKRNGCLNAEPHTPPLFHGDVQTVTSPHTEGGLARVATACAGCPSPEAAGPPLLSSRPSGLETHVWGLLQATRTPPQAPTRRLVHGAHAGRVRPVQNRGEDPRPRPPSSRPPAHSPRARVERASAKRAKRDGCVESATGRHPRTFQSTHNALAPPPSSGPQSTRGHRASHNAPGHRETRIVPVATEQHPQTP